MDYIEHVKDEFDVELDVPTKYEPNMLIDYMDSKFTMQTKFYISHF